MENEIKNQIFASMVLNASIENETRDAVLEKIDEKQSSSGLFNLQIGVLSKVNLVKKSVDIHQINNEIQDIRERYSVSNHFSVINDQLLPNSLVEGIQYDGINRVYNDVVADAMNYYLEKNKDTSVKDLGLGIGQSMDNTILFVALGCVAAFFLLQQNKK